MRTALHAVLIAAFATMTAASAHAAEPEKKAPAAAEAKPADAKPAEKKAAGKEVTLKGAMVCAKCTLGEAKKCQSVLKVDEGGKTEKYYLAQNDVAEKHHEQVCSGETKATVTGTVKAVKGKKTLTASDIKIE